MQRHLAAFEADLVIATRTRLLTLVPATSRLAQARTDSATDTALGMLSEPEAGLMVFSCIAIP